MKTRTIFFVVVTDGIGLELLFVTPRDTLTCNTGQAVRFDRRADAERCVRKLGRKHRLLAGVLAANFLRR